MKGTLLLIPTELERRGLVRAGYAPAACSLRSALCGFGPIAAAAKTAQLLAERRPERVLLAGIAGSYDLDRQPLGSAAWLTRVRMVGVGAWCGNTVLPPSHLGFPQLPAAGPQPPVFEELSLSNDAKGPCALTVTAASGSTAQAAGLAARFAPALIEEMEGFAVALAAREAGVPLRILRAVSNQAGDRALGNWAFEAAFAALAEELSNTELGAS